MAEVYRDTIKINADGKYVTSEALEIRSGIIKLTTTGRYDDTADFGGPLSLQFKVDPIRRKGIAVPDATKWLCLAQADFETKEWTCVGRISELFPPSKSSASKMYYEAFRPGTYAVIIRPLYAPVKKPTAYMGIIRQHKRSVLIF